MNRFNVFNTGSPLYPFRWFLVLVLVLASLTAWHDLTGRRMLAYSDNEWNAGSSGARYHK